jgi:hypothetical protein
MIKDYAIHLGKGFDEIRLGMKESDVTQILGEPEDIDEIAYPDGEVSKTYNYEELGFDLTFESDNDYRLSYISFFNDQFHIMNKIKIGIPKKKIKELAKNKDFSEPILEDLSDEEFPDNELMSFDRENLNLWFTEEILDEIQIGPKWKDDETPIWPDN